MKTQSYRFNFKQVSDCWNGPLFQNNLQYQLCLILPQITEWFQCKIFCTYTNPCWFWQTKTEQLTCASRFCIFHGWIRSLNWTWLQWNSSRIWSFNHFVSPPVNSQLYPSCSSHWFRSYYQRACFVSVCTPSYSALLTSALHGLYPFIILALIPDTNGRKNQFSSTQTMQPLWKLIDKGRSHSPNIKRLIRTLCLYQPNISSYSMQLLSPVT